MSAQTEAKSLQKESHTAASIVWFEILADDVERARKFYADLFGWKIERFPGTADYWHIDTGGTDETLDGALMARTQAGQPITNYVSVESDRSHGKSREVRWQDLRPKNCSPADGLLLYLSGY